MAIGTTTALILGGIAAGGQIASAKMQSNAANKAAKTQTQAADRALALQERVYNESRQQLSPYVSMGANTLSGLSALASRSMPGFNGAQYAKGGVTAAPSMAPMSAPTQAPQGLGMLRSGGSSQTPEVADPLAHKRAMLPGAMQAVGQAVRGQRPALADMQMVMVQAPTGETRQMPLAQAQRLVAKGARIVGGGQAAEQPRELV